MAGKPETAQRPGTSNSALQNVLVYVSGDGFSYTQQQPQPPNGAGPGATSVKQNIGPTKVPTTPTSLQTFYNANGFQNAATATEHVYQGPAVRSQPAPPPSGFTVKSREEGGNFVAVMGGELVFPRCDSVRSETAESSCSSLGSSCGGDSQPMQDTNAVRSSDVINSGASIGVNNVNVVNNAGAVLGVSVNNSNSSGVHQPQIQQQQQQQCKPQDFPSVAAPFGWKRLLTNNIIIYVSPSNTALNSLEQVKAYLQTQGTCKCGLECPLNCDAVFNFDPKVATRPWSAGLLPSDMTRLCNHKRKLLPLQYPSHYDKKLVEGRRIKKRKVAPIQHGSNASVSQLLAQREREREQRNSKEAVQTQQVWSNGSPQQNVSPDGSSVLVQSPMLGNPLMNRVQYPPGYHESSSGNSHSGNQPIVQHQPNQAPMPPTASQPPPPPPPPPQYFRYNPVGCNISNCNPGINPNNQQSGMVDNGQVICNNNSNPSTPVPFSAANGTYIHQPVLMTGMGTCSGQDNNLPGQNSSLVIQPSNCVPPGHMIVSGHQHQSQNFIPQQQRLHMGCADGSECPHTHCSQGGKPAQMINQSQIFMPQHDNNVMSHIQQQAQQQQTQPQQQIVHNQHHSHPMQHNIIPQHIMNSASPRPTGALVNQQVQNMVQSHQNYDPARVGPQFHAQHQIVNPQEQSKNVQVPLPQHVHLLDVNKVNYNIAGKNNAQVMIGSGPNNRGIVCENYSTVQTSRNENIHQPSAMVLQTSQGQVMIPPGQVASALVVQNQQGGPNGSINVGTSQPMRMMNLPNSSVVVQGSPGTAVLSSGHTINSQGQAMVLHSQHGSSMVSQGLQVQTVGNHQGGVMLQNHHNPPLSSTSSNNNSNSMSAGPGIVTHHQRSVPPWQQNRTNQLQNAVINQQNMNQALLPNPYERVPPLHHHSHLPIWQEENVRKKGNRLQGKSSAVKKQKSPYIVEHHHHHHNAVLNNDQCPNVDVRHIQQDQKPPQNYNNSNVPSFMEDPSGYLAQQTALLNSTISRQTGNGANIICHSPCSTQNQTIGEQNSGQIVINLPASACSPVSNQGVPLPSNVLISSNKQQQPVVHQAYIRNPQHLNNMKVHSRNNSVSSTGGVSYHNQPQSQPGTPDSSDVSPERSRCQACPSSSSSSNNNSTNSNNNSNINNCNNSNGLEGMQANTIRLVNTKQLQLEDSPVTSSTYIDNRGQNPPISVSQTDSRGPIQGGTVSTSNRSPADIVHRVQPDAASPVAPSTPTTPLSSTQNCRIVNSPESSVSSIFVSVSSPFTSGNMTPVLFTTQQNPIISRSQDNSSQLTRQQQPHLNINIHVQDIATSRIPAVVTTMASGHTVSSNTITSVLAGRANTATVSVNPTTIAAPTIPSAVLTNQPVSHQVAVTKSPLEMVQSVVSSIQVPTVTASQSENILKPTAGPNLPAGSILVSNNGQLIVANTSGPPAILSPQQNLPKIGNNSPMPPLSGNSIVTSVTGAVTQVIPAVGVTQQVLGQPTVLVNTLPAPILFQQGVMTVDGTMNAVQIPHLAVATGNVLQQGQVVEESRIQQNNSGAFSPRGQPALLSPEGNNGKRKSNAKKRKVPQTVANMLHIAAQQNSPNAGATTGMVVQQQQPQQNFGNSAPMLQALTILPGKTGHFGGTQQLIATANVLQPLNLVQNFPTIQQFIVPAGLSGMVMATGDGTATLLQDAVQLNVLTPVQGPTGTVFGQGQSILAAGPAGMVIRAPTNNGNSGKVQHVTQGGGQQFIAANSPNQFLMNSPAFSGQLSPMLANVSPTNQQIHSFNTANTANQNRTSGQAQHQEFIQCGQTLMVPCTITQTPSAQNTTVVQQNTTIVQQQTTMVSNNQQSLDQNQGPATSSSSSLSLNQHNFILNNGDGKQPQNFIITTDKQNQGNFILSPNPDNKHQGTHIILNNINTTEKQSQPCSGFLISQPDKSGQMCDNFILTNSSLNSSEKTSTGNFIISSGSLTEKQTKFAKHSVSTQTAANQQVMQVPTPVALVVATTNTFCQTSTSATYSGSPPDTTTHSPVDASGNAQSPGLNSEVPSSSAIVGSTDDNLSSPTSSSDPSGRSQPMVHCVSSSNEQDSPDWQAKEVNMSPSPAIFSPPSNVDAGYNRGGNGMSKTVSVSSYVESSSTIQQFEGDRLHKQHSADEALSRQIYEYHRIESSRMSKRKHSSICSESEARIHTSTLSPQDDDDDSGSFGGSGSETECGADPPGPSAGDLVWGAAHGFRSWPGKLVGPAPTPGRVWVRWFGGPGTGPLSEVDPQDLKTLSEGLEAHHRARKKFRKSRKLDSQLENAIQEAMAELDRMSETPQQGPPMPPQSLTVSDSSCSRTRRNHR